MDNFKKAPTLSRVSKDTLADSSKMPPLPHNFQTLRNARPGHARKSILLMGAGMSYRIAPLPFALLTEKKKIAEQNLGLHSAEENDLYQWADDLYEALKRRGSLNPKLELAEAMDLISEARWWGNGPAETTTPRHRIVARFAREGLWQQIWSYNWDCVQEKALENVGMKRHGPPNRLPWPSSYFTFITAADCTTYSYGDSITIIKPHGCVEALRRAFEASKSGNTQSALELSERFRITKSELDSLGTSPDPTDQFVFAAMCVGFTTSPLIVAGWSASENYLLHYLENTIGPILANRQKQPDDLAIIDLQFNGGGHSKLATIYETSASEAHIPVSTIWTTDDLFLWIQCHYAVQQLIANATPSVAAKLNHIADNLDRDATLSHFAINWADSYLSVWVRLCWRSGLIPCRGTNQVVIEPEDIPLERDEEHVPWHIQHIQRDDLAAAAMLLAALSDSSDPDQWNFNMFPGGLYRETDAKLVIPIPSWNSDSINDLRGLKVLIETIRSPGVGYISSVAILFLTPDNERVSETSKQILKNLLATQFSNIHLSQAANIEEIELCNL